MKKRLKKLWQTGLATTLCASLLVGCGSDSKSGSDSSKKSGKKNCFYLVSGLCWEQTQRFLTKISGNSRLEPLAKERTLTFASIIPWSNYEEKYLSGVTSGQGPDIGYMSLEMMGDYFSKNLLADMDSYFSDEEKENYIYYDKGTIQGKQYALPFIVGNPRLLCWKHRYSETSWL